MISSDFEYKEEQNTARIRLFSNKRYNIMTEECAAKLDRKLSEINKQDRIRAAIMHGDRRSFLAGLDINIFKDYNVKSIGKFAHMCTKLIDRFESPNTIYISAVDGYCLGGGLEMVMATDHIIASKKAKFGLPEIKLGLIPGADGIKRLVRCVGKRKALELLLTGKTIDAKEARDIGLVNEITTSRKLMRRAEELAKEISSTNPAATKAIKRLASRAHAHNITDQEIDEFQRCIMTEHAKTAIKSFLDKR